MTYLYTVLIALLSSFLWRVRGGLRINGKKLPMNKIWYAVFFSIYGCILFSFELENALIGFFACYTSYQLYGWGLYISSLLTGCEIDKDDRECELIDDLLFSLHVTLKGNSYYLYQYPRLFGFCGTTLTGLIITFLWGLFTGSLFIMLSGLGMGVFYWLGGQLEKLYALGKSGWNWGEWCFAFYEGLILAKVLLW